MSKSILVTKDLAAINVTQINVVQKQTVTQLSSLTTAVAMDAPCGFINTVSTNLGTQGSASFFFANAYIQPGNLLHLSTQAYTGTGGSVKVSVNGVTTSGATITVSNSSTTSALNGAVTIGYIVL